jgi:predicted component of type VI protein secretion system
MPMRCHKLGTRARRFVKLRWATLDWFMAELLILNVGKRQIVVDRALTVGRGANADIRFACDVAMSREHARITPIAGACVVDDLGSTNGTFVNGQQVTSARRLRRGDLLRIGDQEIRVGLARDGCVVCEDPAPISASLGGVDATRPAHVFDLITRLTNDALRAGDPAQAERLSASHLRRLLADAQRRVADPQSIAPAVELALILARALADARWLEYVLELHEESPTQVNEAMLREVLNLARLISNVNLPRIERWVARHESPREIDARE